MVVPSLKLFLFCLPLLFSSVYITKILSSSGLMSYMSTRVLFGFLEALETSFRLAQDFDARPGLKFLLQKVASLETAANLYKTAAMAILFQVHALVQACAHLENASISSTR